MSSNLILARVPGSLGHLALYECIQPYVKPDAFFDSTTINNFKVPLFMMAFAFVIFYQVRKNRRDREAQEDVLGKGTIAQ